MTFMTLRQRAQAAGLLFTSLLLGGCALRYSTDQPWANQIGYETVYVETWDADRRENRCRALYWHKGLLVIQYGSTSAIYKPGDGLFAVFLRNRLLSPKHRQYKQGSQGCQNNIFWDPLIIDRDMYVVVHPELKAIFDNARSNPQALISIFSSAPPEFTRDGRWKDAPVADSVRGFIPTSAEFEDVLTSIMPSLSVATVFPDIEVRRKNAAQAEPLRLKADAEEKAEMDGLRARIMAKRKAALTTAISAFQSAAERKQRGETVCSADNRIGYVEDIASGRVKVSVRGLAAYRKPGIPGRQVIDEPYGPFGLDYSREFNIGSQHYNMQTVVPIRDKYYLFFPGRDITFVAAPAELWDDAKNWARCTYRVSL